MNRLSQKTKIVQCPDCLKFYDQRDGHICKNAPEGRTELDDRLDDPRHGQAEHINRGDDER